MGITFLTGASSGIGRSLALRLAASGESIAAIARRRDLLDSLVAEIEAGGGRALAVPCDVTDPEAVREGFEHAASALGAPTRLIANAGGAVPSGKGNQAFSAESFKAGIELNLLSVAYCVEAVLPGMLERGSGHLVCTSSLAGVRGLPGAVSYSAAKGALTNFMESLRIELRPRGIDVTVILPGFVRNRPGAKRRRPFVVELEDATARMQRVIEARRSYDAFPRSLVALVTLGRHLPASLYDRLLGRALDGSRDG